MSFLVIVNIITIITIPLYFVRPSQMNRLPKLLLCCCIIPNRLIIALLLRAEKSYVSISNLSYIKITVETLNGAPTSLLPYVT